MSEIQEKEFEKLCPLRSALGREFLGLQAERNRQKTAFENAKEKMAYDTTAYRRSELALARFLDDMLALLHKHMPILNDRKADLFMIEYQAKNPMWQEPLAIDRKSEKVIWTRFAIERYGISIKPAERKRFKIYHPELWKDLRNAWREFRKEIRQWKYGGQPFDGSRAMHAMISFQVKTRLMGCAND